MNRSCHAGSRYLAGLVILFAIAFFVVGTLGPPRRSPFYLLIIPPTAAVALFLGWRAWRSERDRSTAYSAAALVLLVAVLGLSHLLPRSTG